MFCRSDNNLIEMIGNLGFDPRRGPAIDPPVCFGSLAVDMPVSDEGSGPLWISIIAFGEQAQFLAGLGKGALIKVTGRLERPKPFDKADGNTGIDLTVVAHAITPVEISLPWSQPVIRPASVSSRLSNPTPSGATPRGLQNDPEAIAAVSQVLDGVIALVPVIKEAVRIITSKLA